MSAFLHGWRRKAGCIGLLIACLFATGWVRSFVVNDLIAIPHWNSYNYVVSSSGDFAIQRTYGIPPGADPFWITGPYDSDKTVYFFLHDNIEWRWRCAGLAVGDAPLAANTTIYLIPYWSLTLPPTLLSAYLILWKPRKRAEPDV